MTDQLKTAFLAYIEAVALQLNEQEQTEKQCKYLTEKTRELRAAIVHEPENESNI